MKLARFVSLVSFVFPINIYFIGDNLGTGIQIPFLRFQYTAAGLRTMFIWREVELVLNGIIGGRTALSILVWLGGSLLLIAAAILFLSNREIGKMGVITYGLGCALFVISTMIQYGPLFNGPAGVAIPIGLPLLVVVGYLLWRDAIGSGSIEKDDDASCTAPLNVLCSAEGDADD